MAALLLCATATAATGIKMTARAVGEDGADSDVPFYTTGAFNTTSRAVKNEDGSFGITQTAGVEHACFTAIIRAAEQKTRIIWT